MQLSTDVMYQAILNKDTSFEGVFFTAVKTTGIFCRPSCRARKPKKENVEFFSTVREAITKGYRPCRVCNPMENLHETPPQIKQLMDDLNNDPSLKIRDRDLRQRKLEPNGVRRWFLKHYGLTFHAYQRMLRINTAFKRIQEGQTVTDAAFNMGYDSLSGFGDSFRTVFGFSPSDSKTKRIIDLRRLETSLGTMYACAVQEGICLLEFTDRRMLETEFRDLGKKFNANIVQGHNPHFALLEEQLREYFEGSRKAFTVPLCTPGSEFQLKVWSALREIPYGETRSYKQQAEHIGSPEAVRAVAQANGMNKIAIIIPCHRVIGGSGELTGYGGGIWRKKKLLDMEKMNR
ncbi:bifunctional transcriptional activator/DNA repair enzyme AdaA [Chitinophaga japonensis]|uniref:Methylated-DNA--protein-cysteine methyltransferase n=1 Tax=Chitinophaga japonensis TaxID=104662 RepID=A0A562T6E0_CHIJA|nr:methylated-DNA--[protein]-cysteine S-methyltransferase [Chitinophaga japonensis]TWI88570.1 AraC family transcriptional regulator of adaptative response/methylated-DNA-[protein]-cysteine methyltransferase [Chitinophaga japonensis]